LVMLKFIPQMRQTVSIPRSPESREAAGRLGSGAATAGPRGGAAAELLLVSFSMGKE
jgi:hypothetical protein